MAISVIRFESVEDGSGPGERVFSGVDFGARTTDGQYGVAATNDGRIVGVGRSRAWQRIDVDRFDITGIAVSDDTKIIAASDRRGTVRVIRTGGFREPPDADDDYVLFGARAGVYREAEFWWSKDVASSNRRYLGLTRSQQTITILDADTRARHEISREGCGSTIPNCLLAVAALSDDGEALLVNLPDFRLFRVPTGTQDIIPWVEGDWIVDAVVPTTPEDMEQLAAGVPDRKDLAAEKIKADEEGLDVSALSSALAAQSRFVAPALCDAYESGGNATCDRTDEVWSAKRELVAIAFDDYLAMFDPATAKVRKSAPGCFYGVDTLVFGPDASAVFARGNCGYDSSPTLSLVKLPLRGDEARDALCTALTNGRQEFTDEELVEFSGLLTERDRNPCKRNGLLTWDYYRDVISAWFSPAK